MPEEPWSAFQPQLNKGKCICEGSTLEKTDCNVKSQSTNSR